MTRDSIVPIDPDDESFPCERCGGAGTVTAGQCRERCADCGGSGYGAPPEAFTRMRAHSIERLSRWARRALPTEEV